ncbi:CAP domain-containing protein [Clostridium sp. C2-6-12]|uniref:CAP domain-containing protein n=1 Tax=Clostridium sp. C2-6-12 TaxID=2698832 RepID=UPI00136C4AF0|nr:CAP domain-containing protein [Clostridium sp. C2-6-12]
MMKKSLRRMVTAAIVATTIGSFSSIGVSAATFDSNINNYYNTIANNFLNTGLVIPNNITSTDNLKSNTATNNTSTSENSVYVQGLATLPTNYSINVQDSDEQKILELMNAKRTEAGLKPLTMDNTLVQVARYKSDNMIQNNFFSHTNPDGTKWTNRLQTIGYKYTTSGENIAYNTYDPVELFNQWWNSPGHRANMMNTSYTKVGIGVIHGNGKYMGTQTFSN